VLDKLIEIMVTKDIWGAIADNKVYVFASKDCLDLKDCFMASYISLD